MFQFDFGGVRHGPSIDSSVAECAGPIYVGMWEEHCLECAQPECYRSCSLYVRRADGNCARTEFGIIQNLQYCGQFPYSAEVKFRKWGKLHVDLSGRVISRETAKRIQSFDSVVARSLTALGRIAMYFGDRRQLKPQSYYNAIRKRLLKRLGRRLKMANPEFVGEIWNLRDTDSRLVFEFSAGMKVLGRESIALTPGHNLFELHELCPVIRRHGLPGRITMFPENDEAAHLAISWLTLFEREPKSVAMQSDQNGFVDGPKIKCVVWDLDETLWEGIVGERGVDGVKLKQENVSLVKRFDEMGIVQSVASKNTSDIAEAALRRFGLTKFFLAPQINWLPKSQNVKVIADSLNIGLDTFVFIDDSKYEREEVQSQLPNVWTVDASNTAGLLKQKRFDVPVTEESKKRRLFYQTEALRKDFQKEREGDNLSFLRSCELTATVSDVFLEEQVVRCHELLQRTNQLNLSGRRLTVEEVEELVAQDGTKCFHISCEDRFGSYGIVGFASLVTIGEQIVLSDLVISCRVAVKKVEAALLSFLLELASELGKDKIVAQFRATERNHVLGKALVEAGMKPNEESSSLLEMSVRDNVRDADVVKVKKRFAR